MLHVHKKVIVECIILREKHKSRAMGLCKALLPTDEKNE